MKISQYIPREYEKRDRPNGPSRKHPLPWLKVGEFYTLDEPNSALKLRVAVKNFTHPLLSREVLKARKKKRFSVYVKEGNISICIRKA